MQRTMEGDGEKGVQKGPKVLTSHNLFSSELSLNKRLLFELFISCEMY